MKLDLEDGFYNAIYDGNIEEFGKLKQGMVILVRQGEMFKYQRNPFGIEQRQLPLIPHNPPTTKGIRFERQK